MRVLLATTNRGKAGEIEAALSDLPWSFLTLADVASPPPPPEETGAGFADNARLKAEYYRQALGFPALADDSGLCVDALQGAPGVETARTGSSDPERIAWVLKRMLGIEGLRRSAHFVCALCLQLDAGERIEVEGRVAGMITHSPRGKGGFGLDPIFFYPPAGCTFAELSRTQKSRVSHRARALAALRRRCLDSSQFRAT